MIEVFDAAPPADRDSAFTNAPMGVALTTPAGVLLDVNPALERLLGRSAAELCGQSVLDQIPPDLEAAARDAHAALLAAPDLPMRHETRVTRPDGSEIPVQVTASSVDRSPGGDPAHLVMIVEDITERKELEAQLVHRSMHDPLTGLANRLLFQDRLWHALERGHRERTPTCVLIIDLDGFKKINDELGHPMGDLVLVSFAERLRSVLRASDTAARLGGDEFSIVCENTEDADAEVLAARLRTTITEPLELGAQSIPLGISIGIGCVPGGEEPGRSTSGSSGRPTTPCTRTRPPGAADPAHERHQPGRGRRPAPHDRQPGEDRRQARQDEREGHEHREPVQAAGAVDRDRTGQQGKEQDGDGGERRAEEQHRRAAGLQADAPGDLAGGARQPEGEQQRHDVVLAVQQADEVNARDQDRQPGRDEPEHRRGGRGGRPARTVGPGQRR